MAAGPGLSLRHAGPFGRSAARTGRPRRLRSRRHDRRSGVPVGEQDVLPLAEPGEQAGSGLVDAEGVQRHPARWRPGVSGPAEPVLSSAVLDHDHAKTIVSEDTVQPSVGQINGCEQSGAGHTASVQLVQHLSGRTPARGPARETHGPSPSTIASIRPRRHQTRRWLALRLLRRLRRAGIQSDGAEGEAYVLQHHGGRENLLGNGRPRLPIARNRQSPKSTRAPTDPGQRDVPGACGFCAARVSPVRASACGARTARLAVRLLPLLTASTASLSLLLGELVNRVSVAQLERPVEDRLLQVGCVLDDARRASHRSTTNTQSGGRLRLSQDVRVRRRTMTLGLLRGNRRKQRELLRR